MFNKNNDIYEYNIQEIKKIMTAVSTGEAKIQDHNDEYIDLYKDLDNQFKKKKIQNPNKHSDLWNFYTFWKVELPTYAERRAYVQRIYDLNNTEVQNKGDKENNSNVLNQIIIGVVITVLGGLVLYYIFGIK